METNHAAGTTVVRQRDTNVREHVDPVLHLPTLSSGYETATQDHDRDEGICHDRNVRRARDNLRYISDQVAKGMGEIKEDIGKELRITDRLTSQNTKLATILQRFAVLEENVIELVRMDCNRESVRIETPADVSEEIRRIVAAAERKSCNNRQRSQETVNANELGSTPNHGREIAVPRNPLSKFSACGPRDATATRKTVDCRLRIATTPECLVDPTNSLASGSIVWRHIGSPKLD
ncbi:uncharacterized protein LOC143426670 [Xylocopa sonorina]|uniref:uncharacterized protein LOC143426670 n=1 Tax=Xylocopa sonorina TaxID=1818115 RepID=UPI00403ACD1E